jgi:AcrR family transcriptional regulator
VSVALKILHSEGIAELSLRRIARDVGVAPSAVYNHFQNREALLAAVAADGFRQLQQIERRAFHHKADKKDTVYQLASDYLRFAARKPNLYRLMFSPDIKAYRNHPEFERAGDRSFGLWVEWWYGEGSYDPGVSAINYPNALAMWSLLHGAAMQMIDGYITVDMRKNAAVTALSDALITAFLQGPLPQAS